MREAFDSQRLSMRPLSTDDDLAETRACLMPRKGGDAWTGLAITLAGDTIGTVSTHCRRPGVYEVGYMLVRRHWGHGYAREAVSQVIDLLIDEGDARRIFADTDPENVASIALLERLGFRREGVLREEWETHIGVRDTLLLGLLASEWRCPTRP